MQSHISLLFSALGPNFSYNLVYRNDKHINISNIVVVTLSLLNTAQTRADAASRSDDTSECLLNVKWCTCVK